MAAPCLTLLGCTGSGKSTTGNILLAAEGEEDIDFYAEDQPFRVGHGRVSVTQVCSIQYNKTAAFGIVVDTPGLGDIPDLALRPVTNDEAACLNIPPNPFCESDLIKLRRHRTTQHFQNVTQHLHDSAGFLLFCVKVDNRAAILETRAMLHALSALLHDQLSSCGVLVLTGIPYTVLAGEELDMCDWTDANDWLQRCGIEYNEYLHKQRVMWENDLEVKFAACLGLADPNEDLHPQHAASWQSFRDTLKIMIADGGTVGPGMTMELIVRRFGVPPLPLEPMLAGDVATYQFTLQRAARMKIRLDMLEAFCAGYAVRERAVKHLENYFNWSDGLEHHVGGLLSRSMVALEAARKTLEFQCQTMKKWHEHGNNMKRRLNACECEHCSPKNRVPLAQGALWWV